MRANGYRNLIIGVTGNVLDDDIQKYLQAGADLILGKPLKMDKLIALLKFAEVYGTISHPGKRLMERDGQLCWISCT